MFINSANPVYHQLLVGVLWEIVVHQNHNVRCSAAPLFTVSSQRGPLIVIVSCIFPVYLVDTEYIAEVSRIPSKQQEHHHRNHYSLLHHYRHQGSYSIEKPLNLTACLEKSLNCDRKP